MILRVIDNNNFTRILFYVIIINMKTNVINGKVIAIYSMANSWKNIRNNLEDHLFVMFEHLVKVYYYHDYNEYIHGWITSIRKGFELVKKLSNTNRYPTKEQMFQFIWNEWLDGDVDRLQDTIVSDINDSYEDVPKIEKIDYDGFRDFAKTYCEFLSQIISEKGTISIPEIKIFIEEYFSD